MAQRRIQFDIKDLQFIRDVLKDASFSETKWFDLGLKLKLRQPDLEVISKASNDASDCLRECLTLWLKSGKATPHLLVRLLKSVDEAPAAEYARKILLDVASQLLLSYRDKLSQSFLTDDLVGLLRSEGVISKDTQEMIMEYGNILEDEPLRAVCVTVADDHQKLKVLADVLLKSSETALLGRELSDKYCEIFPEVVSQTVSLQACQAIAQQAVSGNAQQPVSEEEIYVSEAYKYDFDTVRGDYGIFRDKVIPLLSSKIPVSTEELKHFLGHTFPELKPEITHAQSIDAIINIVGGRINIINIAMIESIVKRYDVSEAKDLVTQYKKEIQKFTSEMKLKFVLDKKLSPPISSLDCETIKFVLDWEPSDHSLDDICQLLKKAFGDSSKRVLVRSIHEGNSIIIICYAPRYLINVLLLEAQANLHVLKKEMNLVQLDVGHFTVYNKKILEKEVVDFKEELEQAAQKKMKENEDMLLQCQEEVKNLKLSLKESEDESQGRKKMQHAMIIQNDLLLQSKSELENSIDKSKEEIEALQEKVSVLSVQLIGCASATFKKQRDQFTQTALGTEESHSPTESMVEIAKFEQIVEADDALMAAVQNDPIIINALKESKIKYEEKNKGEENASGQIVWSSNRVVIISPDLEQCIKLLDNLSSEHRLITIQNSCAEIAIFLLLAVLRKGVAEELQILATPLNHGSILILSHFLSLYDSLEILNISQSSIDDEGLATLCSKGLLRNTSLSQLHLQNNPGISSKSSWALFDFLNKGNSKMQVLSLNGTSLTSDGIYQLLLTKTKLWLDLKHKQDIVSFDGYKAVEHKLLFL